MEETSREQITSLRLKTTRAEVDDLDGRRAFLTQQNVLRFHVTMDDVLFEHHFHALQNRIGKTTHQMNAKSLVVVLLDQLVQIDSKHNQVS
jgi:hypothetical protein